MSRDSAVYNEVITGRSVELVSKDKTHEWKMENDLAYREAYIKWCWETNR